MTLNWKSRYRELRQAIAIITAIALLVVSSFIISNRVARAQNATQVPGFFALESNLYPAATTTGQGGTVTNPSSNFVIDISGGPVYCSGDTGFISPGSMTLAASTTFLVVYNCAQGRVYSKTAVTGPGSSGTSQLNQPGNPASILYALAGIEVPLSTVVCNATACGNGGNGSITDSRSTSQFGPTGPYLSGYTFSGLPSTAADGVIIMCTGCTQPTAGSATCTTGSADVLAARMAGAWRCF